jgi:hypothetical protein
MLNCATALVGEALERSEEGIAVLRIDAVFDRDQHRPFVGSLVGRTLPTQVSISRAFKRSRGGDRRVSR